MQVAIMHNQQTMSSREIAESGACPEIQDTSYAVEIIEASTV